MVSLTDIRQKIVDRDYFLSSHAEEEMVDDHLERNDIEHAIFKGEIEKKLTLDLRGTRYRIEGPARDGRTMHVVCRLTSDRKLVIITVYVLRIDK